MSNKAINNYVPLLSGQTFLDYNGRFYKEIHIFITFFFTEKHPSYIAIRRKKAFIVAVNIDIFAVYPSIVIFFQSVDKYRNKFRLTCH